MSKMNLIRVAFMKRFWMRHVFLGLMTLFFCSSFHVFAQSISQQRSKTVRLSSDSPYPEENDVVQNNNTHFMQMEVRAEAPETNSIRYPESSGKMAELAPIYAPNINPTDASARGGVRSGAQTDTYKGGYLQGVYWPYRYQPYTSGSRWSYSYWPYENNVYWQGSPWPYERGSENQSRRYEAPEAVTLDPRMSAVSSGEPLSDDERAELEMWRRVGDMPIEVTFYGQEAFVRWGGSAVRVPVPKDGKIQIKLSPRQ